MSILSETVKRLQAERSLATQNKVTVRHVENYSNILELTQGNGIGMVHYPEEAASIASLFNNADWLLAIVAAAVEWHEANVLSRTFWAMDNHRSDAGRAADAAVSQAAEKIGAALDHAKYELEKQEAASHAT